METPPPPSVLESKKFSKFSIKSNQDKEYSFTISLIYSKIEIFIESITEIHKKTYKSNYTLEQLCSINKYFKLCEKLEEAYQIIIDNLESSKIELNELTNDSTSISFQIVTNDKLCGNISFEIPLSLKTEREDINEIYEIISKLKSEKEENEKNLKNEIKILKDELEKVKSENKSMKELINNNHQNLNSSLEALKNSFEFMNKSGITSRRLNAKNNCGDSSVQFFQSAESYENSEQTWAHYIVLNHCNGNSYYQVVVRFPFWGGFVQIGKRENGAWKGWKNINISY
jgi:hypothetical protein